MKSIFTVIAFFFFALSSCGKPLSENSVKGFATHGGDNIEIRFSSAREKAVFVLKSVDTLQNSHVLNEEQSAWYSKNRNALWEDVKKSSHVWDDELPKTCNLHTCACTEMSLGAPVYFSLQHCKNEKLNEDDAAKLLIHESMHHLGVEEEDFVNRVVNAIFVEWSVLFSVPGKRLLKSCTGSAAFDQLLIESDGTNFHITLNSLYALKGLEQDVGLEAPQRQTVQTNVWFPISSCSVSISNGETVCHSKTAVLMFFSGPEDLLNITYRRVVVEFQFGVARDRVTGETEIRFFPIFEGNPTTPRAMRFFSNSCVNASFGF